MERGGGGANQAAVRRPRPVSSRYSTPSGAGNARPMRGGKGKNRASRAFCDPPSWRWVARIGGTSNREFRSREASSAVDDQQGIYSALRTCTAGYGLCTLE
eukprot:COSAG01_NODE_6968_length_3412_cov_229.210383_3_plen_101_part_00